MLAIGPWRQGPMSSNDAGNVDTHMKKMKGFAVVALAALSACSVQTVPSDGADYPKGEQIGRIGHGDLHIFRDNEHGNVCYMADRNGSISLSCVPLEYAK